MGEGALSKVFVQEECKTSGSFEAKLLLLHLGSMSGKAVAPLLPAQLRLHHTDSQKLDRLYELASFVDRNSKDNLFPGQPPGNKRKRSVSLNPEPPSQVRKSVSTGSSRPLRDTFQVCDTSQSGCKQVPALRCVLDKDVSVRKSQFVLVGKLMLLCNTARSTEV